MNTKVCSDGHSCPYIHDSTAQDFSFVLYTYTSTCNVTMLKQGLLPCFDCMSPVTLTLKTTMQLFHMTLQCMMMYHHKFGYKRSSESEDTVCITTTKINLTFTLTMTLNTAIHLFHLVAKASLVQKI